MEKEIYNSWISCSENVKSIRILSGKPWILDENITYCEICVEVLKRDDNKIVLKLFKWPYGRVEGYVELLVYEINPYTYQVIRLVCNLTRKSDIYGIVIFSWSEIKIPKYYKIIIRAYARGINELYNNRKFANFVLIQEPL